MTTNCLPREIAPRLECARQRLPVVVLSGLRQTGKSTLLQNEPAFAAGHTYRTLDDFATLAAALLDAHLSDAQLAYWHEQGWHEQVLAIEIRTATRWNGERSVRIARFLGAGVCLCCHHAGLQRYGVCAPVRSPVGHSVGSPAKVKQRLILGLEAVTQQRIQGRACIVRHKREEPDGND